MSEAVLKVLKQRFPEAVLETHSFRGDETAVISREAILKVADFVRNDPRMAFEMLVDLFGVDYLTYNPQASRKTARGGGVKTGEQQACDRERFEVVYHLHSLSRKHRLRLKVHLPESNPVLDSVTDVWIGADWYERECFDMFGIRFMGHPNLERLLMYDGFVGHPLRKDYPVRGRQPRTGPVK